ncbi:unnamed protein product [Pneumocystis jirovecii]|uniref:Uncharacterized protein n=1 Tax=Pneumocystis jirovecii TaxID=42068 RepID=L0PAQ8_PNEJI|nr:unnamed protein product [Pneumocystis jirovecii]
MQQICLYTCSKRS